DLEEGPGEAVLQDMERAWGDAADIHQHSGVRVAMTGAAEELEACAASGDREVDAGFAEETALHEGAADAVGQPPEHGVAGLPPGVQDRDGDDGPQGQGKEQQEDSR